MMNMMVRVIMGVGVITASFVAGQHSVSSQPNQSGLSLATAAVTHSTQSGDTPTVVTNSTGAKTTGASSVGATTSDEPTHTLSLSKQIHLADTAALDAVGGGQVMSVTTSTWRHTPAWNIQVEQGSTRYDVLVSKAQHQVLAKTSL